ELHSLEIVAQNLLHFFFVRTMFAHVLKSCARTFSELCNRIPILGHLSTLYMKLRPASCKARSTSRCYGIRADAEMNQPIRRYSLPILPSRQEHCIYHERRRTQRLPPRLPSSSTYEKYKRPSDRTVIQRL